MRREEYESDVYYGVVMGGDSLLGWTAPDVGMGAMRFVHPEKGEFKVNKGSSHDWMRECWKDFIKHISEPKELKE